MLGGKRKKRRVDRSGGPRRFPLDAPLLTISDNKRDWWTIRDACEGTQIFGAIGSGKTSGSGRTIAKAMLNSGFGGLVLTAKPDERYLWERYCEETGRSESLLIFGPDHPHRFNFLDYELKRPQTGGGRIENLVQLFLTVMEVADRSPGSGGGQDPYWRRAVQQLLRSTIELVARATGSVRLEDIIRVITTSPQDRDEVRDGGWQSTSYCYRMLQQAEENALGTGASSIEVHDLEVTVGYMLEEFPSLADRTRSSIVSTFTTMADGLLRGELRELFCTETTVLPELTHQGVILLIDLPVKRYHELGRTAQVIWKYLWQRATEAREVDDTTRPVFLWADEAQNFVTTTDMDFQATARSSRACTVYLTQNLPNYYAVLGGQGGSKATTDSLMGNLQTKIFHANTDPETNRWAEELIGKGQQFRVNASSNSGQRDQQGRKQDPSVSAGASEVFDAMLAASTFPRLAKGGPSSNFLVEGIFTQGGRQWAATGQPFARTWFTQKGP